MRLHDFSGGPNHASHHHGLQRRPGITPGSALAGAQRGHQVVAVSLNLGQEVYLEPLGELALELGAVSAQVLDRREVFLRDFALPVLQADAVYQSSCYLGSALARYLIAQELVRIAHDEGCDTVAHAASSKGNDQVRMETAIALRTRASRWWPRSVNGI